MLKVWQKRNVTKLQNMFYEVLPVAIVAFMYYVVGKLFSRYPSVRACVLVRPSVTFCFLNILKSHCWIFIKPCKHIHICKTNTLDEKVRARGQFY